MSKRSLRAALVMGAAVLAAGCAAVGPNFKPPAPVTASSSYVQPGDMPNAGPIETSVGDKVVAEWWTMFHSPALDGLVREAIANNGTLEAARARLTAARAAAGAEGGQLFFNGDVGFKRERANLGASGFSIPAGFTFDNNPEFNLYTIGTSVSYNLDLFGGLRRRREALAADAESKARELDAAYLTLTGQVVVQALTAGDASVHIAALGDIVANDQTDVDIVRRAYAAGGASAADVTTVETQLAEDQAAIPPHQQRLAAARHQLAVLVGKAPSDFTPPDFDAHSGSLPMHLPVALPSELVRGRPDILQAEARLHAATARIGVATADLYPNITLSGALSQDALTPEKIFAASADGWSLGPSVTIPLFHSGELHAKKREAEADARAELATYKQTVLAAFAQVDDSLQAIAHDNEAYARLTEALDSATSKLEMMRRAYKAGGVSAYQLVDAERSWRRTRLNLSDLGRSRIADAARLLLATATVPPGVAEAEPASPAKP